MDQATIQEILHLLWDVVCMISLDHEEDGSCLHVGDCSVVKDFYFTLKYDWARCMEFCRWFEKEFPLEMWQDPSIVDELYWKVAGRGFDPQRLRA